MKHGNNEINERIVLTSQKKNTRAFGDINLYLRALVKAAVTSCSQIKNRKHSPKSNEQKTHPKTA